MNQHPTTRLNPTLNKPIALGEMLEQILIFDIIYLDSLVREAFEETLLDREFEHGKHVSDPRLAQRFLAAEREQPG